MIVKIEEKEQTCLFCKDSVLEFISDTEDNNICICFSCVSDARKLVSEYRILGECSLEEVKKLKTTFKS